MTEEILIEQSGSNISGTYVPVASGHPDGYLGEDGFVMEGSVRELTVLGRYRRANLEDLRKTGVFQLKLVRETDWLEGACTFYTWDRTIGVSLNIWIRRSAKLYSLYLKQAKQVFEREGGTLFELPLSI